MSSKRFGRKWVSKFTPLKELEMDKFCYQFEIVETQWIPDPPIVSLNRRFKKIVNYLIQARKMNIEINHIVAEVSITYNSFGGLANADEYLRLFQQKLFYYSFIVGLKLNIDGGCEIVSQRSEAQTKQFESEIENLAKEGVMNNIRNKEYVFVEPVYIAQFKIKENEKSQGQNNQQTFTIQIFVKSVFD
ncbi:MAG: hypothetical protein OHK0017_11270 [Patescibacteria group bacterium]